MTEEKRQLTELYVDLIGKKPFAGWNEEKLQDRINEFKEETGTVEVEVSAPRVDKVEVKITPETAQKTHSARHEANEKIRRDKVLKQLFKIQPVFIEGKAFAIMNDKYVPWAEAELICLKKVNSEIDILIKQKELENNPQ